MRIKQGPANSGETLLSFNGQVTDDVCDCILKLVEHKLQKEPASKSIKRRVFSVLVESIQNVYHHFEKSQSSNDDFLVNIDLKKDSFAYIVSTGNHVSMNKVQELRSVLDRVNAMSRDELRIYYRDQLSKGQFSNSGGAGLGFAEIIRKSREKITYSFEPVNKDYSYFSLQVKVSA